MRVRVCVRPLQDRKVRKDIAGAALFSSSLLLPPPPSPPPKTGVSFSWKENRSFRNLFAV